MVNQQEERKARSEPKDEVWVFQPKLRVHGNDHAPLFVQRKTAKADLSKMDRLTREETETLEMIYRHQREFAVGHGMSVHATLPEALAERAIQVETEWVPSFEVPQQTPRSEADDENLAGLTLDMKQLAEPPKAGLIASLRHIETDYRVWIKAEEAKLTLPSEKLAGHEEAATRAVKQCRRALERLKAGINLIDADPRPKRLSASPTGRCGGSVSIRLSRAKCARKKCRSMRASRRWTCRRTAVGACSRWRSSC
jgi:hypothetical protein